MEGRGTQEGRANSPFTATMSEPAGQPEGLRDTPDRSPADPPSAGAPSSGDTGVFDPAAALFGEAPSEPTDDTPTVISKQTPRAVSSEEVLAGVLRGKTLAHFELMEAVGVGGMAAVLRARDTQLDRIVALKILPPEMAADPENVRRFHQEARSAAKLDHENVARVFFCGEDQNLHFIAFEFVEGENLRTLIDRQGHVPFGEAIHYMLQVASGLAHAASRGVVHRDIKPSNIVITPDGRAKLVDMGLARSLEPHHDGALTQSGVTLGTFDYISPEQAIEPREADVRSDIYSLGCTFYHALTGQPPVPEGTAAKKLHHHQQVAPIDPRQLNPEIPDEVAAILARMMAKDPKARYQRPEHLVQHLLAAAQKLGTASTMPKGIHYVDAALPEPPRVRPFLLAAIGIAAVVVLVLLISSSSWTPGGPDKSGGLSPLVKNDPPTGKPNGSTNNADTQNTKNPNSQEPKAGVVRAEFASPTFRELADFLANHADAEGYNLALSGDVRLTGEEGVAEAEAAFSLLAPGKKLTLRAKDESHPPTLHIAYNPPLRSRPVLRWVGLLLRAEEVTLSGLRVVLDARFADTKIAGIVLQGGRFRALNCVFLQENSSFSETERSTSLLIDGSRPGVKPQLTLEKCVFVGGKQDAAAAQNGSILLDEIDKGGQDAVTVAGSANIVATQCAFGPHAAPFVFEGGDRGSSGLKVRECTAIAAADDWSAFRLADGAACEPLEVQHCLFARPDSDEMARVPAMMDQPRKQVAVLIRQAGSGRVRYEGRDNRFYHLEGFWFRSGDEMVASGWPEFQNEVRRQGGSTEERSGLLAASPWAHEKPIDLLHRPETGENLREAFQLKDNQRELRQDKDPTALVGVSNGVWGPSYAALPVLEDPRPPAVAGREPLVVDPEAKTGDRAFPTVNAALEQASPGDVLLIKHDGPLPLELARLAKPTADITIKPSPNYHPILTMAPLPEKDAALFTVHDGKLTFEGLEFLLQPSSDQTEAQAVVKLVQDGACTFNRCVITLKDPRRAALAVVVLADRSSAVKMDKNKPENARVKFEDCFVRGEGDLVWLRASRPFDFDCGNSLVALNGSLLNVEAGLDDASAGQAINVKLSHLTTYLGSYLVRLKAGRDLKTLVPIHCNGVADCLFVAANKKTSLIHVDGPSSNEQRMKELVKWDGGKNNAYSDFDNMLEQQPPDEVMADPPYGQKEWKSFTGETEAKFNTVKFADAPGLDTLAHAKPTGFKLRDSDAPALGVKIDDLPRPGNPDG